MTRFDLTGKTALVTGSNSGIGQAIAIGLAEAGANIIGVAHAPVETYKETEESIALFGKTLKAYQCDLTDRAALYDFIKKVKQENPPVDILFNNAGMILRQPAAEHSDEYWDKVITLNLDAQFLLTREFGKDMVARKSGKIVFTCSLLTFQGGINVPGYAASKGAVGSLVKAFANEWASHGVNVNGFAPGYIATENTAALRADAERSKSILDRIPAGRWGEPADFQGPAIFLASPASDYVNGEILVVDGGWMGR